MRSQESTITAKAKNTDGSVVERSIGVVAKPLNIVLVGQKIVSKEMDDKYVETCGKACAKKLDVTAQNVSTGLEFINALEKATENEELSACVFWGHSWAIGLYLQNNQGLYLDKTYDNVYNTASLPVGARKLSHLKSSLIRVKPHSLFIFASCGTATDPEYEGNGYFDSSFAGRFGFNIDKINSNSVKEDESFFKVTVIGATALSNLLQDGTVRTDGAFMKIETLFKTEKKAIYKEVVEGKWWWKETRKVFDKWDINTSVIKSNTISLGKKIDPSEIIKKHNPNDTSK